MIGERLVWYTLADHLHMPIQDCKRRTTSGEFVDWKVYFEIKEERRWQEVSKLEHYLAKIIYVLWRALTNKYEKLHDTDGRLYQQEIMKFQALAEAVKEIVPKQLTEDEIKAKIAHSKARTMAATGYAAYKKKGQKKKQGLK